MNSDFDEISFIKSEMMKLGNEPSYVENGIRMGKRKNKRPKFELNFDGNWNLLMLTAKLKPETYPGKF